MDGPPSSQRKHSTGIYIYIYMCVCVCVPVGMDITICAILLAATAHSCLLWFYFTIPMFVLASSPSQALLCFFLLSCSPPPIKNNPAIKGLNVDQNLRAQKLPPPVWKYALLHDLFRGCTWLSHLARLIDIYLNENWSFILGEFEDIPIVILKY